MGRALLVEVEGFVDPATRLDAAQATGRAVESAVRAAVPEARVVRWTPKPIDQ
jgi:hypothetical protein